MIISVKLRSNPEFDDVLECIDKIDNCAGYVASGYCTQQYVWYMTNHCAKSCGFCGGEFWIDNSVQNVNNVSKYDYLKLECFYENILF